MCLSVIWQRSNLTKRFISQNVWLLDQESDSANFDATVENDDGDEGDDEGDEGDEDDEDEDGEDGEDIDEDEGEDEIDDADEEDEADDGDRPGNDDEIVGDEAAAAGAADTTIDVRNESPDEGSNSGDDLNTEAIVGGVLGGFAILGLIAVAFFYLILRHRRHRKRDELAARHASGSIKSDAADVADAADGPDIPISPTVVDDTCTTDIAATTPKSDDGIADVADAAEMGEPKVELPIQTESQEDLREVLGDTPETRHPVMKDGKEIYEAPGCELTSWDGCYWFFMHKKTWSLYEILRSGLSDTRNFTVLNTYIYCN